MKIVKLKTLLLSTVFLVVYRPPSLPKSNALFLMKSPLSYKTTCKTPVRKAPKLRFLLGSPFHLRNVVVHFTMRVKCELHWMP